MRRRGNKSTKVPNVKLRPAHDVALRRSKVGSDNFVCWAEDTQPGSDDTAIVDLCPRPFKGAVICATGVADKPTLFKQALELGATTSKSFTDRVTHLVAMDHGGAKYMCALERKIPILKSSWITESYNIWLRGDDVDFEQSVATHRLPIFSGIVLCLSGIDDVSRRMQINKLLTQHEGIYVKNLERPVRVTHLLCSGDEETDKMKYAEKFNTRGEANVHLVWEEWFWDSLEFGGRFDEKKYQVRRPRPERKTVLENTTLSQLPSATTSEDGQERREESPQSVGPRQDEDLDEEAAAIKRLPAITLQLWGSLLKPRGYEVSGGELLRSPSKVPSAAKPTEHFENPPEPDDANGSIIRAFRRSNSFAPPASLQQPPRFKRTQTLPALAAKEKSGLVGGSSDKNGESSTSVNVTSTMFAGLKFLALGEAKSPSVRNAIEQNSGTWVSGGAREDVDFIIVRLVSGSKFFREESEVSLKARYRTECWLERCIFEDRLCSPEEHVTFIPLNAQMPVLGAEKITLSISGFDQSEACWLKRLFRAIGVNLAPGFSRRSTHLLCPSGMGAKFDKAREWNIPVMTVEWFSDMASTGQIPPVSGYLVQKPAQESSTLSLVDETAMGDVRDKNRDGVEPHDGVPALVDPVDDVEVCLPPKSPTKHPSPVPVTPRKRRRTTSSERQVDAGSGFGRPNGLLDGNATVAVFSTPQRPKLTLGSTNLSNRASLPPLTPTRQVINPAQEPSGREIERERKQARIPSSKSPSPMKLPSKQGAHRGSSASPTKVSKETAKALQESIATLLGKRNSVSEDSEGNLNRPGKRARPQRTRPQSRQSSLVDVVSEELPIPAPVFGDLPAAVESLETISTAENSIPDESMRVMYDDPDEKKRLMSLLKEDDGNTTSSIESEPKGRRGNIKTRRSARIAGF